MKKSLEYIRRIMNFINKDLNIVDGIGFLENDMGVINYMSSDIVTYVSITNNEKEVFELFIRKDVIQAFHILGTFECSKYTINPKNNYFAIDFGDSRISTNKENTIVVIGTNGYAKFDKKGFMISTSDALIPGKYYLEKYREGLDISYSFFKGMLQNERKITKENYKKFKKSNILIRN